ncbi:hypothetical protein [Parageobacillus thermoglucosidasius]|jgi:hypothetical protein|uniref:Uncharacterized protein n=1 Tax=Parageobacillus thermoglucosidasius TaxID=1426 RepID=A0AAN1D7A2_PARTM|nr:hypothetical protein [Parageobacillus thermoglucosidasius]ALF10807.1 hypothetical protein AOT13_12700 [Parageobacillus thermoglucosidasius]ANZ30885.1 hypothetical protein BCV53_12710 [Parageobacillus thermoglucosidasius]APM81622.1 hypothetical protein BCV54_12720 [Parageobacillus thermoglucosidasius]KJX67632.1 hypothetical protein WH82_16690 [Parageobacillus thermoglucosidasius]RDE22213.1 hypothetical protein DV712_19425 [Parageobacillus thermoglucosidasius]
MDFEQAFNEFVYNRVEQIMLNDENIELQTLYKELDRSFKKLQINEKDFDDLQRTIFCLIDSLILLAYKQALEDTISFLLSTTEAKRRLGVTD